MHIPDGYLSPETATVMYLAAAPFWIRASQKIKTLLRGRSVPLLALFSAFSFLIMMLNIPIPNGTTAHAVGTVLAAIVLGPWAAIITTSVALIIQALFFGDGGILNIGANCFNMAVSMAFVGYYLYRWIGGDSPVNSTRRVIAGAIAGYAAINISALLTGIELGLQPILFHNTSGAPLYFPYALNVTLPALLIPHLTLAGLAEALATALPIVWLQRSNPQLLRLTSSPHSAAAVSNATRTLRWGWVAMAAIIIITPIGLLAPGTAWGEWGRDQLSALGLNSIPAGFDRFANLWSAPLSGYDIPALNNPTITYMLSAVVGVVLIFGVIAVLGWGLQHVFGSPRTPAATNEARSS